MYTPQVNTYGWQTGNRKIVSHRLPSHLEAPPGWHSEIVHSNSPVPIFHQAQSTAYQQSFVPTNVYDQQQFAFNEQQERNIVHQVQRQTLPPVVIRRQLPNNSVVYRQNISVRYLQPPPLPPPGPLIIREVRPPQPPPLPPIRIRERQERPPTPPPVILRERPPPVPAQIPAQVIEKVLPPPPQAPRGVIVEHFGRAPPKPPNIIIERWLPYKSPGPRRVLVERAPPIAQCPQERNLVVHYDSPKAHIHRQYENRGVVCTDPADYLRQYGSEIDSQTIDGYKAELLREASRAAPPPPSINCGSHRVSPCYENVRSITPPLRRSVSYHDRSTSPYVNCGYQTSRSYVEYPTYCQETEVTPSWNARCNPCSSYSRGGGGGEDYYYSSSYSYPMSTIRVHSEAEFRDIMCNLTRGRVPASLGAY